MTKILEELPVDNAYRVSSAHKRAAEMIDAMVAEAKAAKEPVIDTINLTPAIARVLLERNPLNRRVYENTLKTLMADIENGDWVFNGEPIIVADTGDLNDGQHRCEAVLQTGKPIKTVIIVGLPRESRVTLDQGRNRSTSDYLHMLNIPNSTTLAAVAGMAIQYKNGIKYLSAPSRQQRPTKGQVVEFVRQHPALLHSIRKVDVRHAKSLGSVALFAFCHYILSQHARAEDVDRFFFSLFEGAGLPHGNAILYLRSRLMLAKSGAKMKGNHQAQQAKIELIFRCWNLWRRGKDNVTVVPVRGELPDIEA